MRTKSIFLVIYLILIIVGITGWVKCVIKLTKCDFKESYKAEAIYGVGTLTGLGAVLGYMEFGE